MPGKDKRRDGVSRGRRFARSCTREGTDVFTNVQNVVRDLKGIKERLQRAQSDANRFRDQHGPPVKKAEIR